jgi:hypothetical protein
VSASNYFDNTPHTKEMKMISCFDDNEKKITTRRNCYSGSNINNLRIPRTEEEKADSILVQKLLKSVCIQIKDGNVFLLSPYFGPESQGLADLKKVFVYLKNI